MMSENLKLQLTICEKDMDIARLLSEVAQRRHADISNELKRLEAIEKEEVLKQKAGKAEANPAAE